MQLERNILHNRLQIKPVSGGVTIADWNSPGKNYSVFYAPEISYRGIDNLDISAGAFLFTGKGEGLFQGMKDMDMLRLRISASF